MKRLLYTISVVVLGSGLALAQSGSSNNDQQNASQVQPSPENPPGVGHDQPYAGPTPSDSGTRPDSMSSSRDSSASTGSAGSTSDSTADSKHGSDRKRQSKSPKTDETDAASTTDNSGAAPSTQK